jgi:hypothetical protein
MSCAAWRAIARLRNVRDEIELAARPAGDIVVITRRAADAILNDVGVAARLVRKMVERDDD